MPTAGGEKVRSWFIPDMNGHSSPRLGVRFALNTGELVVFRADGRPFQTPAEMIDERDEADRRAAEERQRASEEKQRAEEETLRAAKLAAKLRELGVDPDKV